MTTARAGRRLPFRHVRQPMCPSSCVEPGRPRGPSRNLPSPAAFEADRLIAVEVSPRAATGPATRPTSTTQPHARGGRPRGDLLLPVPIRRTVSPPTALTEAWPERSMSWTEVRDGDVSLSRRAGTALAVAHGYDVYYLNVLAGPEAQRTWQISRRSGPRLDSRDLERRDERRRAVVAAYRPARQPRRGWETDMTTVASDRGTGDRPLPRRAAQRA